MPDPKPRRRFLPRFSLRTLLLFVLLCASAFGLWWRWEPWVVIARRHLLTSCVNFPNLSPDRRSILKSKIEPQDSGSEEYALVVMDALTLRERFALRPSNAVREESILNNEVEFSADGRWLLRGKEVEYDKALAVDAESGAHLKFAGETDDVIAVKASANSRTLLVWLAKGNPEIWSFSDRRQICRLDVRGEEISDVAISPSGRYAAVTQHSSYQKPIPGHLVSIWDVGSGKRVAEIVGAYCTVWEPLDDEVLQVFDERIFRNRLFDVGRNEFLMDIPPEWILAGAAPDGRFKFQIVNGEGFAVCNRWSAEPVFRLKGESSHHPSDDVCDKLVTVWAEGWPTDKGVLPTRPWDEDEGEGLRAEGPWKLAVCEWNLQTGKPNWVQSVEMGKNEYPYGLTYSGDGQWAKLRTDNPFTSREISRYWKARPGSSVTQIVGKSYFSPSGAYLLNQGMEDTWQWTLFATGSCQPLNEWPRLSHMRFLGDDTILASYFDENGYELSVWQRRRPEYWWGVAWLPEFYLMTLFGFAVLWSLVRDFRTFRKAAA